MSDAIPPSLPSSNWTEFKPGWVWLVGAGPGDPGLLTLHALNALKQADVVVYDALVEPSILEWTNAEQIYAGKRGGKPSPKQRDISLRLVELARAGKRVLRLKGGDPFVFGRGGEEAQTLIQHDIPVRIVPGISAGIGGLAYAGIPVTHRDVNQSVTFITGHDQSGMTPSTLDWDAISKASQVLVIYMGMKHIGEITSALLNAGRPGSEPVAIVTQATTTDQTVLETTLDHATQDIERSGLKPPAIICVGRVVEMRQVLIAGIVLNRVGSDRHEAILREALSAIMTPILGVIRRSDDLKRASRHLGLVQASEDPELDRFLDTAAKSLASTMDIEIIAGLAAPLPAPQNSKKLPPLGKHIAIAKDEAFTFIYPHLLKDWQDQGVALSFFSPLADQTPSESADAIYLPGGYPELHAQRITRAGSFRAAMRRAAQNNTTIYGECGGYMVLGNSLTDARDIPFPMLGLLDLDTSFSKRKLHLGYRNLSATKGPLKGRFKAHEFHYATILRQNGTPLFEATDATGCINTQMGLVSGSVSGSFAHIIDRA